MIFFLIAQLISNLLVALLLVLYRRRTTQIINLYQTQAVLDRGNIARLEAELESQKWKGQEHD